MKRSATLAGLLAPGLLACADGGAPAKETTLLEVLDPTGSTEVTAVHAARLSGLEAQTICLLSDHQWEANRILAEVGRQLEERHPSATVVGQEAFPDVYGVDLERLLGAVRSHECKAAILASAG